MYKEFLALGLSEHRVWGLIFLPFALIKSENRKFYNTVRIISSKNHDPVYDNLTDEEKQIVALSEEYSEHQLFRLFSKHKNLKEFHEKVTKENRENFIRPYIDKRIGKIFNLALETGTGIFNRDKTNTNVFEEDFFTTLKGFAEPSFHFVKDHENSFYSLKLRIHGSIIDLQQPNTYIVSDSPAVIRLNRTLFTIRDIEAKKVKPFFIKERVTIPKQAEVKYFRGYVLNIIRNFKVEAAGFTINQVQPSKQAVISLEKDLHSEWVLVLRFIYGKKKILANSSLRVFVDFHNTEGEFYFDKYKRDEEFEERWHQFLQEYGLISMDGANYKPGISGAENQNSFAVLEWINKYRKEVDEAGFMVESNTGEVKYFNEQLNLTLTTKLKNDWFDIYALVKAGTFEIPFIHFKKNILNNIREYTLPDFTVMILPQEWFTRYRGLFEFCKTGKKSISLHKQHFNIVEGISSVSEHREVKKLEKLSQKDTVLPVKVPSGINGTLRPYQLEGFTWLLHLQQNNLGGCLADDMGLGKTLQTICILSRSKELAAQGGNGMQVQSGMQLSLFGDIKESPVSLIVVPASLVHNWVNEVKKFAPSLSVFPYIGVQRIKQTGDFRKYDIIVSSYHTVRQDIELLSGFPFHYVILDESQVIKNTGSKVFMAIQQLRGEHRLALTGTPVENSLTDLWAQMNFVNPGLLGNLAFFKKEFVFPIERKNEPQKEERLKKLIEPFILRRTKDEVAPELPEVTEQVIYCTMTDEQRRYYEREKSGIRNYILESIEKEGIEKTSIIVLQGLTRLRQIANHPVLADNEFEFASGKFDEVLRNVENVIAEGHKALLFSSFVRHLNLFEDEFNHRNIRYQKLTGESTGREDIIKAFREHRDCSIFLISLKAGGVGLNLTEADYVFILDPWWNPASEQQAISRSHRIGQKNNVFVYRFISENSIEEKIQKLQIRKSELAETFITSNNPMKHIGKEELDELFG